MVKKFLGVGILLLCFALSGNAFCQDLKIGYVNMRRVFHEYKKTKDFNQKLEGEDAKVKKEIDKKTQAIRKLRDSIDLLSEDAKQKKQPELRQKIKDLDDFRRNKVEGFLQKKDAMFKEIREDILAVSTEYAKKNNYNILFDEAVFVYSTKNYDVTDKIIKELNK